MEHARSHLGKSIWRLLSLGATTEAPFPNLWPHVWICHFISCYETWLTNTWSHFLVCGICTGKTSRFSLYSHLTLLALNCVGVFLLPLLLQFSTDTDLVSYNSIQFNSDLPKDRIRSHSFKGSVHKNCPHSDTSCKSRLSPTLLADQL
jgi:hypothetical protein